MQDQANVARTTALPGPQRRVRQRTRSLAVFGVLALLLGSLPAAAAAVILDAPAPAGAATISATWTGGNPDSSCDRWFASDSPPPNTTSATLQISGAGGGGGVWSSGDNHNPQGGFGGEIDVTLSNLTGPVSGIAGCGGSGGGPGRGIRPGKPGRGGGGYSRGATAGRPSVFTGNAGGGGGGSSGLCLGVIHQCRQTTTGPRVIAVAGGGGGAGGEDDCIFGREGSGDGGAGWSGPRTSSHGFEVEGGGSGNTGSAGYGGGGGTARGGGAGGRSSGAAAVNGMPGGSSPSSSKGGSGGTGPLHDLPPYFGAGSGGGGGAGYTGGGGGGGDGCRTGSAGAGGGGGGASAVNMSYTLGSVVLGDGAARGAGARRSQAHPGGNGYINLQWTPSAPTIISVVPGEGPATGGTPITITGTNLAGDSSSPVEVTVGGRTLTITSDSSTQIVGTVPPGTPGPADVTVTTDGGSVTKSGAFTYLSVSPVSITTSSLPAGVLETPYPDVTLSATGGATPYSWSATGLPPGLSLDSVSGELSGVPTRAGDFDPTFVVTDADNQTDSVPLPVTIAPSPPPNPSSMIILATPSTVPFGNAVLFSATVSGSAGVPTGTVAFSLGTTPLCTASLVGGAGSCSSSAAPEGAAQTVSGEYSGSSTYAPTSATTPLTVTPPVAPLPSRTTAEASPNVTTYGTSVSYGAIVSSNSPGTPTGQVDFSIGSTSLCHATLAAGNASCDSAAAPLGPHQLVVADYHGDHDFGASSGSATVSISAGPTSTSLTAIPPASTFGQSVTYTAAVSTSGSGPSRPSGQVRFSIGSRVLCVATVHGSSASCSSSAAPAGNQTLVASYGGDVNFAGSSASLTYRVATAPTRTTGGPTPVTAAFGSPVSYRAQVSSSRGVPTGQVSFSIGTLALCTASLVKGSGNCSATNAPVGTNQTVSITYLGDANFNSSSAGAALNVSAGSPGCSTSGSGTPSAAGGYWLLSQTGTVFSCGNAPPFGPVSAQPPGTPIIGLAWSSGDDGYWLATASGGVFAYGAAPFYGSMGGTPLNQPVVGMAATPGGGGYWLVASDGGVFAFGDAHFYGSMGGTHLNQPVVGMTVTPDGGGYWLVASDGGIFAFGDAHFYGSMGGTHLNQPVVGMAPTSNGHGYWLVASDGGIFAFGDAPFFGSMGGTPLNRPVVGMAPTTTGAGYWLVASDGGIFAFGDAGFYGSAADQPLSSPMIAILPT